MRNTSISIIANNKVVQQFDIHGQSMSVKAIANVDFVIQEQHSGKSPKQLKAKRQHNDLVLYADGDDVSLIIQDYYTTEDVGILGVQDNGMASYGLNSSQVSQLSGEETIYGLSNTVIDNSTSNDYTSYLLGLLGVGAVIGIATSNDNKSTAQPSTQQTTPTTPTQPSTPTEAKITEVIANKSVNEGETVTATVKLDNANGNAKVAFALTGLEANDYANATFSNGVSKNADGTLNISKGIQSFTVTLPIVADKVTEGNQTLTVKVGDKTATTTIVDTSTTPATPPAPTPTPTDAVVTEVIANKSVNEGENLVATVKLDNTNGNGKVAFALSGLEANDYGNATFSGGVTKNVDGTLNVPKGVKEFNVTLPIVADKTTEGNQSLTVKVGDKSTVVNVIDTSTTPVTPPAPTPTPTDAVVTEITANKSVNEGENLVAIVKLDNTNGNGKVAFALSGLEANDYDATTFSGGVTKNADGTLNVPKGIKEFTITLPIVADKLTEGNQSLTVKVGDKTATTTIVDTSTAPVTPPSTTPTPDAVVTEVIANKSVNEGESVTATVKLDNTNGNGKVAFALSGTNITDKDYNISFNGVTKNADGTLNVPKGIKEFTITLAITADNTTEGEETLSLNVGGKSTNVKIVDSSIADINGINVNTRIIDANWDLQGGPTAKDRTGNAEHYYVNNNTENKFVSNIKHHTDGSGLATTEKDDTIAVTVTAGTTHQNTAGNIVSANIDLAGGDDKLTANTQEFSSVHFGEGNDTYTLSHIEGGQNNNFAKVFMETGNDTLTTDRITDSHVYMGGGNDTVTSGQLTSSILDLGTGGFKYTHNNIEYDDHQAFYADSKTALNSDKADETGMANTVNIKNINGSTIRSGLADDTVTIDKGAGQNTINLSDGTNKVTIVDGHTNFTTNSSIITGIGNDAIEIGGNGNRFDMTLGEGNNHVKITTTDKSQQNGNITTLSGNDVITIQAGSSKGNINVGDGDNQITITATENHTANITAGSGKDTLAINSMVDGSSIDVGAGNNEITLTKPSKNDHAITASSVVALDGDDILTINGSVGNKTTINLGAGTNAIKITGTSLAESITTLDGNDTIIVEKSIATTINVGAGDNTIDIKENYGNGLLTAGNGNDTVNISGNSDARSIALGDGKNTITIGEHNLSHISTGGHDDVVRIGITSGNNISLGDGTNVLEIGDTNYGGISTGKDKDAITIGGTNNAQGSIDTNDGNDSVTINGDNRGNISLGEGNNSLIIKGTNTSKTISAGSGDDTLKLAENIVNDKNKNALYNTAIDLGDGNNNVEILKDILNTTISVGNNDDTITINDTSSRSSIALGDGINNLTIAGSAYDTSIKAGSGVDTVNIAGAFGSKLNETHIDLGDGNNTLNIANTSRSSKEVSIRTGKDNDTITISGNNEIAIHAGAGNNNIKIDGTNDLSYGTNSITTLEGDDTINIKENNKATINAGDGTNTINIGKHNTANITVGSGNDVIVLGSSNTQTINLGEGDNKLTITGKQGQGLTETLSIIVGNGSDIITLGSLYNTNIDLKGGKNALTVNGEVSLHYQTITANSGNDSVHLNGNVNSAKINYTGKDLFIAGNVDYTNITLSNLVDEITINGTFNYTNEKLTMRGGDDILNIGHIDALSTTGKGVDGGRGFDTLNLTGGGTVSQPKTIELRDLTGFEVIDMTSKDGNGINVLDLYGSYSEYAKSLDGVTGLYIRGDDEDAVKMSGYFERFSKTGQTVTGKDNEQYVVWQNTNDPNLLLYIQDNVQIL